MAIQMPASIIVYNASRSLLRAVIVAHQVVQRRGGFGIEVVKLTSKLIKVREEVCGVVHGHVAGLNGIKQGKVLRRSVENLHVHVTKTFIHVHLRREQSNIRLSPRRKVL
jgi:hypothetical protein